MYEAEQDLAIWKPKAPRSKHELAFTHRQHGDAYDACILRPLRRDHQKFDLVKSLAACQKGMAVAFVTAASLVNEVMEARDEKRLLRLQRQLAKVSFLIIDELGFVPLSKTGAELLFELTRNATSADQPSSTATWRSKSGQKPLARIA